MSTLTEGTFYYINDDYFTDFPDSSLMQNKETVNGQPHNRPCFFAFADSQTGLMWMIPISSQVGKLHQIEQKKIARYGKCETILFGEVLGHEKAFLIQNMCPIIPKYILNQYMDTAIGSPVRVDGAFEAKLKRTAQKVLAKQRSGVKMIFPDVIAIEKALLSNQP